MSSYSEIIQQVQQLSTDEQLRLLEELTGLVRRQVTTKRHSIFELEGLGKELWQGINAQEYVNRERDSWNG